MTNWLIYHNYFINFHFHRYVTFAPGYPLEGWTTVPLTTALYSVGAAGVGKGVLVNQPSTDPNTFFHNINNYAYFVRNPTPKDIVTSPQSPLDEILPHQSRKEVSIEKVQPQEELSEEELERRNAAQFAPYKNHPKFGYAKNKNTIESSRYISFKAPGGENQEQELDQEKKTITLIIKPEAKAIAGLDGKAIATPIARAAIEKGTNVDILFEPEAVAIVGPGGIAHAQSELEIGYIEDDPLNSDADGVLHNRETITHIPFYGGAKGQTLQIIEENGKIKTRIIKTKPDVLGSQLTADIMKIQRTAQNIIKLQELAKQNGELNDEDREAYEKNLDELNTSAKNLANFQQKETDDISYRSRGNLQSWFETKKRKHAEKLGEPDEETTEENVGEQTDEGPCDGVEVNLPPDNASVAEAKPVGLAVAGAGGVAASKPIATAVVGPKGLAIARPVATAIAGVSPDEALVPITEDGYLKFPQKKRNRKKDKEPEAEKEVKEEEDRQEENGQEMVKQEEKRKQQGEGNEQENKKEQDGLEQDELFRNYKIRFY